mmetsp:Transcript_15495/g.50780  ORF Transcript_15495/g.50780 Transcript_15495/m.50780 type:complete len:242 (+) Transcript_15495:276-1001(+)
MNTIGRRLMMIDGETKTTTDDPIIKRCLEASEVWDLWFEDADAEDLVFVSNGVSGAGVVVDEARGLDAGDVREGLLEGVPGFEVEFGEVVDVAGFGNVDDVIGDVSLGGVDLLQDVDAGVAEDGGDLREHAGLVFIDNADARVGIGTRREVRRRKVDAMFHGPGAEELLHGVRCHRRGVLLRFRRRRAEVRNRHALGPLPEVLRQREVADVLSRDNGFFSPVVRAAAAAVVVAGRQSVGVD